MLSGVTAKNAGWLSRTIRENIVREKEKANEEIESELNVRSFDPSPLQYQTNRLFKILQALYPPRDVKDFRVVVARDARTDRKPANRTAQITVWNVMGLVFEEGGDGGDFKAGQTFLVRHVSSRSSRVGFANLRLGFKLASQPAWVLDGPSHKCRWNSLPCHRKADTLDSVSMMAWRTPPHPPLSHNRTPQYAFYDSDLGLSLLL